MRTLFLICLFFVASAHVYADSYESAKAAAQNQDWVEAIGHIRKAVAAKPTDMPTLKLAARIYIELSIADTALSYAKRVYDDRDNDKENVLLYAEALTINSRAADATVVLRKYLRKQDDLECSLSLVNALVAADSMHTAELVATTTRNKYPSSSESYVALGNIYFNTKPIPVLELARENYKKAAELDPSNVGAHFNLAICYWKMGNKESDDELASEYFTSSLREWDLVTKLDPKNARAWYEEGKILYLSGRYPQAVNALTKYRELRPLGTGETMASWYLGESLYKTGQCDSAKKHLEDAAASVDSLKPKVSLLMAKCSFQAKRFKDAATYYLAALPIKARWDPIDYWFLGASLVVSGDTARAINVMAEAAERDPKQCTFMFRYAVLLQSRYSYSRSTDIFRVRLANCSDSLDPKILVFIGNNFYADSLVDSAIAAYESALAKKPGYTYATLRLGEAYLAHGAVDRGQPLLEQVVAEAKTSTNADERRYGTQAIMRLNSQDMADKKWASIVDRSKTWVELDAKSSTAWLYLAIGYQGQQDVENAKKSYREVLKLDPANDTAKKNLKALGG